MIEKEIFNQIAAKNFGVFSLCSQEDIDYLRSIYKDKDSLRTNIALMLVIQDTRNLKSITRVEIISLLTEFLFDKCDGINNIEICALYSIFWETLNLSFKKNSNQAIYSHFRKLIVRHAMDRPPYQIGILTKSTIEKISIFYIDNIYSRYNILSYMLKKNKAMEIVNKDMFEVRQPHVLNLAMAIETLPRNVKILKQYTENKKPKSDLEKKIEMILEFEREKLDVKLEEKFVLQDQVFNKKLDEILAKKGKK
jgi:hypothetical protein